MRLPPFKPIESESFDKGKSLSQQLIVLLLAHEDKVVRGRASLRSLAIPWEKQKATKIKAVITLCGPATWSTAQTALPCCRRIRYTASRGSSIFAVSQYAEWWFRPQNFWVNG